MFIELVSGISRENGSEEISNRVKPRLPDTTENGKKAVVYGGLNGPLKSSTGSRLFGQTRNNVIEEASRRLGLYLRNRVGIRCIACP